MKVAVLCLLFYLIPGLFSLEELLLRPRLQLEKKAGCSMGEDDLNSLDFRERIDL